MAYYYVNFGITQRSKNGNALRRAAYQRCTQVAHFDFSKKAHEHVASGIMLPDGADPRFLDPVVLWNAAEAAEKRKDAQISRTFEISIPREIPEDRREEFAQHMLQFLVDAGYAVDWSIHNDDGIFDGEPNPHVHGQATMRQVEGDSLAKKKDPKFNAVMREDGGWAMRHKMADAMNEFMQGIGLDARVSAEGNNIPRASAKVRRLAKKWRAEGADPEAIPEAVAAFFATRDSIKGPAADLETAIAELEALEAEEAAKAQRAEANPAPQAHGPTQPTTEPSADSTSDTPTTITTPQDSSLEGQPSDMEETKDDRAERTAGDRQRPSAEASRRERDQRPGRDDERSRRKAIEPRRDTDGDPEPAGRGRQRRRARSDDGAARADRGVAAGREQAPDNHRRAPEDDRALAARRALMSARRTAAAAAVSPRAKTFLAQAVDPVARRRSIKIRRTACDRQMRQRRKRSVSFKWGGLGMAPVSIARLHQALTPLAQIMVLVATEVGHLMIQRLLERKAVHVRTQANTTPVAPGPNIKPAENSKAPEGSGSDAKPAHGSSPTPRRADHGIDDADRERRHINNRRGQSNSADRRAAGASRAHPEPLGGRDRIAENRPKRNAGGHQPADRADTLSTARLAEIALQGALYDPIVDLRQVVQFELGDLGPDGKPVRTAPQLARQSLDQIEEVLRHGQAPELRHRVRERRHHAELQAMPSPSPPQPEDTPLRPTPRM